MLYTQKNEHDCANRHAQKKNYFFSEIIHSQYTVCAKNYAILFVENIKNLDIYFRRKSDEKDHFCNTNRTR